MRRFFLRVYRITKEEDLAQTDLKQKSLEELNDVFADIINVLLFDGRQVVSEDELEDANPRSNYSARGKIREQERDVAKFWRKHEVRFALLGLENQSVEDEDMPLRVIGYDGAAYRNQIRRGETAETKERYPVVSLVLYFGTEHPWRKPKSLHEYFEPEKALKPFVSDYRVNVFDIAFLSDEEVARFQSDFRLVADYFVQVRKNKHYNPPETTIRHVSELLTLMSAVTQDNRLEEIQEEFKRRERVNMNEVIDYYINLGEERGIRKGISQGMQQGMQQKEADDVEKMSEYFLMQNPMLTKEQAVEMAESILRG